MVHWIEDNAQLKQCANAWHTLIALDTEFMRTDTFFPKPGLYQVAFQGEFYLIDPLAIDDWQCFVEVLEDETVCKVMHACQEDLELLVSHLQAQPKNVFDTQLANAFVSPQYSLSYAALVAKLLQVDLPKHETRSNWLKRPLSDEQLVYAAEDVLYLEPLYDVLCEQLSKGAEQRFDWYQQDMQQRGQHNQLLPADYYLNVKKAWQLYGEQLAALQNLCAWREQTARDVDVPRNRVVWDDHLYEFAKQKELNEHFVHKTLPRGVAKKYATLLCEVHQQGVQNPEPKKLPKPLTPKQSATVKSMRQYAQRQAEELGMAPELLARRKEVEQCVRAFAISGELSALFNGWRKEVVGDYFLNLLGATGKA